MSLLNIDGNPMRFNNLGDSGLMVSEISFGTVSLVHTCSKGAHTIHAHKSRNAR